MPVCLGEPVTVATNEGPLWAELEIRQTGWGAMLATLYKPPALKLTVTLQDGRQLCFQVVPGMARSGFWLSPLIQDKASFVRLYSPGGWRDLTGLQIKAMTISAATRSGSTAGYRSPLRLRLYRLEMPDRRTATVANRL